MKTKCDFCKTEYALSSVPTCPVKCAVCGHVWRVPARPRKNTWLMFFASVCALLSAIVFAIAVITHHQASHRPVGPLVASVSGVETTTDDTGAVRYIVSGTISNISSDIYGVPDLIIVSLDDKNNILARQKFMPSATLLDAGASVDFSHVLAPLPKGVTKIVAKLAELDVSQGDK